MAIDFIPDKSSSNDESKIDFIPHETIGGHLRGVGKEALDEMKAFVGHPAQSFKESTVFKGLHNIGETGGSALVNSLSNIANMVPGVNIPQMQRGDPNSISGAIGEAVGTGLGFAGSGGAVKGVASALKSIPQLTETIANALSKVPGAKKVANALTSTVGKATTGGAIFGSAQNPDNRVGGAIEGGLLAGVPTAAFKGLERYGGMASDVLPGVVKDVFKGKATPAEARIANEAVGDLPVGAGQILDSPALQEVEKAINRIPLSGGVARSEKVQQAAENQSDKLLGLMRGSQDEQDIARNLQEGIADNAKMHKTQATTNYNDFLNTAKEGGVKVSDTPETQSIAQRLLKEHETTQTPLDSKVIQKLEQLSKPELIPDVVKGQVTKAKEVDEIHNQIKTLKKAGRTTNDPYLSNIYNELSGAMRKDLHDTALNSKNPEITSKLSQADKHYKENVVPYNQKDIQNIVGGKANLENIQNTLTQSKDHIEKVVSDLPENLKKSTAYLKFKSAIKEEATGEYTSEPQKLFGAYNKLSEVQKDKLFSQNEQKEFHKLGILAKASKDKGKASGYLKTAEIAAPLYELLMHGNLHGALAGAGMAVGGGLAARGLGKGLSSPGFRNALVNMPTPGTSAPAALNQLMPVMQAGVMSQSAPQQQAPIDFQAGNVNQLDQQMINDRMLQSDFSGQ